MGFGEQSEEGLDAITVITVYAVLRKSPRGSILLITILLIVLTTIRIRMELLRHISAQRVTYGGTGVPVPPLFGHNFHNYPYRKQQEGWLPPTKRASAAKIN